MNINVSMELAKQDLVNSINEVSKKYNLPPCLLNYLIQPIAIEINNIANEQLKKDMEAYQNEIKEVEENDKD